MLKRKEIGVDLGTHSIKIAIIQETSTNKEVFNSLNPNLRYLSEREVYKVNCVPYTEDYYKLLRESLKDFSKKHKIGMMSLNISVPVDNVTQSNIMFVSMPAIDDKDLEDGVSFEAEQEMAFNKVTDSHFTWKISEKYEEINEYEILIGTMKKDVVNSLSKFKTIKWKINRVILQPILLERIVSNDDIIIDFGHNSTKVYLYERGKLKQTDVINVGGKSLISKIGEYLKENNLDNKAEDVIKSSFVVNDMLSSLEGLGWDDVLEDEKDDYLDDYEDPIELSDEILKEFGLERDNDEENSEENTEISADKLTEEDDYEETEEADDNYREMLEDLEGVNLDEVSQYISEDVNYLIDEIKRIVRAFELQNGLSVENIYYVGELSNLKYLKEGIEADLGVNLNPINVLAESDDRLLYSIAGITAMDPKLNDETSFTKFIKANVDYSSIAIATLALTVSVGMSLYMIDNNYNNQIDELSIVQSEQNNTISQVNQSIMSVEEEMEVSSNFIERMDDLKSQKKWLSDILYMVPEMTPTTIAINNIDIANENVSIVGYSSNYSSIGFFAKELERLGEVEINSIENYEDEDSGELYSVTLDDPQLISEKFKITQSFTMTLKHEEGLMEH